MEWQQLLGFYHVVRLGSFTKAAEATLRTQSALSQQIRSLEEEFSCQLLERIGKRRLQLTPAGEKVLAFAELVLNNFELLQEGLSEIKKLPRGRLQVAAPFTTLFHLLPNLFQDYRRQFPQVQLTILDRPQESVLQLVKNGTVDFGFVRQSIVPGDLQAQRWQRVQTVLMVPPDHPLAGADQVSLEEIARYPLIVPPANLKFAGRYTLEEHFARLGLTYHVAMESANVELSYRYVELGLGLAFATLAGEASDWRHFNLVFIPLDEYFPTDYLAVIMRPDKTLTSYKTAFLNLLFEKHLNYLFPTRAKE
jgi:DNA-binding transcriptional LysR family regulator